MPNPYPKKEHCVPLAPRSAFCLKTADVESLKKTSRQYIKFVCSSGPPNPCDYENKNDADGDDGFSDPSSVNLFDQDSVNLEKKTAVMNLFWLQAWVPKPATFATTVETGALVIGSNVDQLSGRTISSSWIFMVQWSSCLPTTSSITASTGSSSFRIYSEGQTLNMCS
jgi:hypothetical protein